MRLAKEITGQTIEAVDRRAKYLLLKTAGGTAILHLGMSGSLRIVAATLAPGKHDHVDIVLDDERALRYTDPRRFGSLHWTRRPSDGNSAWCSSTGDSTRAPSSTTSPPAYS